ncbi:cysteine hydrolase [Pseudomonas protegens]|uniref:cysteine hydrolase family protein n=1 Tax=Pseudomonas protegens TaxID=380021 RepID=UPI000F4B0C89|nr:isochorismatase family cysteine hydrolase [Pseudomonas protegens]ROL65697.1 cysteine hydrolase [Pseudomonas protegens]
MTIAARPFDYPYNGIFEPQKTALLVIDLQIDFISQEGYFAKMGYDPASIRKIIPVVNTIIASARKAGCLIIHTRQGYRADMADMTDYEKWRRKRSGLDKTDVLLRSSPGFNIDPEIDVSPDDVIIDKTANGAFTYTELDHVLRAKGITHLLFSGCTTDVCVSTTLREAQDRNYQNLLIEDACASGDQYAHDAAIYMVTVENGIFGVVAKSQDVLKALSKFELNQN